jgi:hypothetical protein
MIRKKKITSLAVGGLIILVAIGGYFGIKKYLRYRAIHKNDITLEEASRMGEKTRHKLMVQIQNIKGNAEGRYQRGDIVLIKPGDFEFSEAEKTGFLILHMDITDKQAEVLVRSLQKDTGKDDSHGEPQMDSVKRRKYMIDFSKIGISENDQQGRERKDKIFGWDVVIEKK